MTSMPNAVAALPGPLQPETSSQLAARLVTAPARKADAATVTDIAARPPDLDTRPALSRAPT